MIHITLPDGSRKPFDDYPTGLTVAKSISEGLARDCVAMEIEGSLMDLNRTIESDAAVRLITTRDDEALEIMRHSAAHVMAHGGAEPVSGCQAHHRAGGGRWFLLRY
jgi:threonyl-tRNA synthetase